VDNDESDFPIGYKKPPRETRFKPGQSGNPSGRPKKNTITLAEAFTRELNTSVTVTEGGKSKKMTKIDAIAKHQTIKAVQGDHKALAFLIKTVEPRETDSKDNLAPVLLELRAIHQKHETADQNGNSKTTSSELNDKVKDDDEEKQ
jgi:hypothetical protein